MGQSSSWYFERFFHWGTSPDTKLAFIKKLYCSSIPSLEFLILSDGDPRNSSIARVGTPWWVRTRMVNHYTWRMDSFGALQGGQGKKRKSDDTSNIRLYKYMAKIYCFDKQR